MVAVALYLIIDRIGTCCSPCGQCCLIGTVVKAVQQGATDGITRSNERLGCTSVGQRKWLRSYCYLRRCLGNRESLGDHALPCTTARYRQAVGADVRPRCACKIKQVVLTLRQSGHSNHWLLVAAVIDK